MKNIEKTYLEINSSLVQVDHSDVDQFRLLDEFLLLSCLINRSFLLLFLFILRGSFFNLSGSKVWLEHLKGVI